MSLPPQVKRFMYYGAFIVIVFMSFRDITDLVSGGHAFATWLFVSIVTIGMHTAFAVTIGRQQLTEHLDPRDQSWAYMFGDPLLIAPTLAVTAQHWETPGAIPEFAMHSGWWLGMGAAGLVLSYLLYVADRVRYRKYGAQQALINPVKIYHTFVVVPIIVCSLMIFTVPLLWHWTIWTKLAVVFMVAWFALLYIDDQLRFVNPVFQYRLWDNTTFAPLPVEVQSFHWKWAEALNLYELSRSQQ